MSASRARLRGKTCVLALVVIFSNVLGNFFLSRGVKSQSLSPSFSPLRYIEALFNPWVMLGVSLLLLWMMCRMTLLSWADLSYVLPVSALGYVLNAMMGRLLLGEQVSLGRWTGIVFIVAGVSLVGLTPEATTAPQSRGRRELG